MYRILLILIIACSLCGLNCLEHEYTRKDCEVVRVTDKVTLFKDTCGHVWEINDTNYKLGEIVKLKMHDNCTDPIEDDKIIKVIKK